MTEPAPRRRVIVKGKGLRTTKQEEAAKAKTEKAALAAQAAQRQSDMELASTVLVYRAQGMSWESITLTTGQPTDRIKAVFEDYLRANIAKSADKLIQEELNHLWWLTNLLSDDLKRGELSAFREAREVSKLRASLIELGNQSRVQPSLPGSMLVNGLTTIVQGGGTVIDYSTGQPVPPMLALEAGGTPDEYIEALELAQEAANMPHRRHA